MAYRLAAGAFCVLCAACAATGETLLVNPDLHTPGPGDNAAFDGVLTAISEESGRRLTRSTAWNVGEAAFGLGTLAAAAYGGYNASYDGENLKDAAFAAASIVGLKEYLSPGPRRDANLEAAARLSCLHRTASTFAGDQTTSAVIVASMAAFGAPHSKNFTLLTKQAAPADLANAVADLALAIAGPAPKSAKAVAESELLDEDLRASLVAATESEADIYAQRFVLVATVYRGIRAELAKSTKFSAGAYDSLLADFTVAVEEEVEAEAAGEAASHAFAAQTGKTGAGLRTLEEAAKKYAAAKAAMLACAPLN